MTTILDLPIHPLAVHAPVILVPLLALFGMVYLFIPPLRRFVGWVVAALTLVAPAAVYGSILSGEQLADFLYPDGWPQTVVDHRSYGYRLLWILIGLIPVWWLFVALERGRRAAAARNGGGSADDDEAATNSADPAAGGRKVAMLIVGLIAFALLGLAAWMVLLSGHTGSDMRWGGLVG